MLRYAYASSAMERGRWYSRDMEMTLLETIIVKTNFSGVSKLERLCPLTSRFRGYLLL